MSEDKKTPAELRMEIESLLRRLEMANLDAIPADRVYISQDRWINVISPTIPF